MATDLVSTEPATGREIWHGQSGNVDETVERARVAMRSWAREPLGRRIELMRRFANQVRKHSETFAELIARETVKPLWEARTEVEAVIGKVEISVTAYAERTGQKKLNSALQGTAALRHKPHGVMAVLGPYNFPAHLPNGHIIPALIAGNVVIFKPSEKTPAVGEFLTRCFHEAKVPEDVIQCIHGGVEVGQGLVEHWMVDGVLFTGSARAGIAINRKLATDPGKIVALEMGGNNPIVMLDTPKIEDAAATIIQSAFTTAGQRCTAARRLIVLDSVYDRIVPKVKEMAERLIVDEPFADPQPFMGCVIDNGTADLLSESFVALMSRGGRPIMHMKRPDESLPFLSPSILDATDIHEHRIVRALATGHSRPRFRRSDQGSQQHALRALGLADRRSAGRFRDILERDSRRDRQLESADQRGFIRSALRRRWLVRQSSPGGILRRRLLRLSGRQQ